MKFFKIASCVTSLAAFTSSITSTFSPEWIVYDDMKATIGFVQECRDGKCTFFTGKHTWVTGLSFGFMLLSVITLLINTIIVIATIRKENKFLLGLCSKFATFGGGFAVIGASLFTGSFIRYVIISSGTSFGYSCILAWIASVSGIMSGILAGMEISSLADDVSVPKNDVEQNTRGFTEHDTVSSKVKF